MTGQPTVDTSHAIVTEAAQRLHHAVLRAKGELGARAYTLGELLAQMQESRAYTALGFATFEDYLASEEVALHRATAYRFIRVFRTYGHVVHGRQWARDLDLRKLDILARLIDEDTDPAQIEALVAEAQTMPREELRAAVNEEARQRGVLPPGERAAGPPSLRSLAREVRQEEAAAPRPVPLHPTTPAEPTARSVNEATGGAFVAALAERIATDPEYRAGVLDLKFMGIAHTLFKAAYDHRALWEHTSPEELARVLPREELAGYTRDYEERIKPLLAWYEQVLAAGRRGGVQRVK